MKTLSWPPAGAGTARLWGKTSCCPAACRCPGECLGWRVAPPRDRCWGSMDPRGCARRGAYRSRGRGSGIGWKTRIRSVGGTGGAGSGREGSSTPRGRGRAPDPRGNGEGAAGGAAAAWRVV